MCLIVSNSTLGTLPSAEEMSTITNMTQLLLHNLPRNVPQVRVISDAAIRVGEPDLEILLNTFKEVSDTIDMTLVTVIRVCIRGVGAHDEE